MECLTNHLHTSLGQKGMTYFTAELAMTQLLQLMEMTRLMAEQEPTRLPVVVV